MKNCECSIVRASKQYCCTSANSCCCFTNILLRMTAFYLSMQYNESVPNYRCLSSHCLFEYYICREKSLRFLQPFINSCVESRARAIRMETTWRRSCCHNCKRQNITAARYLQSYRHGARKSLRRNFCVNNVSFDCEQTIHLNELKMRNTQPVHHTGTVKVSIYSKVDKRRPP